MTTTAVERGTVNITREFILAGKATFTIKHPDGRHWTFKVKQVQNDYAGGKPVWFVSMLTGPDNEHSYSYVGVLEPSTLQVRLTKASKMTPESYPFRLLNRVLSNIDFGDKHLIEQHGYSVLHEGRCGRCGRKLTVPSSIETGIGPECAKKCGL